MRELLGGHGLKVVEEWIAKSREEGVFFGSLGREQAEGDGGRCGG